MPENTQDRGVDETTPSADSATRGVSRRTLIAGLGGGAAAVVLAGGALGYFSLFAPSADLHRYADYVVNDTEALTPGEVRVTFLGTATLLVDDGVTQILFDAFITDVSVLTAALGKLRTDDDHVDSVLKKVGADRVKGIFVSHSHHDHALDVAYVANATGATLYGSPSTLNIGRGGDVPETQLEEYRVGEKIAIGDFTVTVIDSMHSPKPLGGNGTAITAPLRQPATTFAYTEGGSYDFLLEHNGRSILIKASAGYLPGALDDITADVMFCGTTGPFGKDPVFQKAFYDDTIAKVDPKILIPVHWNDFFLPVTDNLRANFKAIDDVAGGFDYLIERLGERQARFAILNGYSSINLFGASA